MTKRIRSASPQDRLQRALQRAPAVTLQTLTADLLSVLLKTEFATSQGGFQHGADVGTARREQRRLRVECKRYAESTALNERELLGEIDQALSRDESLECWGLVATREVPEQLVETLIAKGENLGFAVLVIDWRKRGIAPLAALCSVEPELVGKAISPAAGKYAKQLQKAARISLESLKRQIESWSLGYETIRARSQKLLSDIWHDPHVSSAELGHNASGGAAAIRIRRLAAHDKLSEWWNRNDRAPVVLAGLDGVGKTWAALDWLIATRSNQPIVLVIPGRAVGDEAPSPTAVSRLLGDCLYSLTRVRSATHWTQRVERLLTRPPEEGPSFTVVLDGVNQNPEAPWAQLISRLQSSPFAGRVRVLLTARTHYFTERMAGLRRLVDGPLVVRIEKYDATAGGEFDQMLALHGLQRADLATEEVVEFCRIPRLFTLAVRYMSRLGTEKDVTVHRLLWEYGRDSFGEREGRSFGEREWQEWLMRIARQLRAGVVEFETRVLAESAHHPDLSHRETYQRLSDIVDGHFAENTATGVRLVPTLVYHALATALIGHLRTIAPRSHRNAADETSRWLDPIEGLDQRAEILRAAVSIVVELGAEGYQDIASAVVVAWLQSQNIGPTHRHDIQGLAAHIPYALLDTVEQCSGFAHRAARRVAIDALRGVPGTYQTVTNAIVKRVSQWVATIVPSGAINERHGRGNYDWDRLRARVGADEEGCFSVLGVGIRVRRDGDSSLGALAASLLEGRSLSEAMACFEAAIIAQAVLDHTEGWRGLIWLCQLNAVDQTATTKGLRALSQELLGRTPEDGVHKWLPARAAALALWLTGEESDEEKARRVNRNLGDSIDYERDYLANPSRSLFTLERRHATAALQDVGVRLVPRIQRSKDLWVDPSFRPPKIVREELRRFARGVSVDQLHSSSGLTSEQYAYEELGPSLARVDPAAFAGISRKWLRSLDQRQPKSRYWAAVNAPSMFLVNDPKGTSSATALRRKTADSEDSQESLVEHHLLLLELWARPVQEQFDAIIQADLDVIYREIGAVLKRADTADADSLVGRWGRASAKQQKDLILLLSIHPIMFSDTVWEWLISRVRESEHPLRHVLFQVLANSDETRFGLFLDQIGWSWDPSSSVEVNHYGSGALIKRSGDRKFGDLAVRVAPWRLLEAVRFRGSAPDEIRLASEILKAVICESGELDGPDPGAELTVDLSGAKPGPMVVSARPRAEEPQGSVAEQLRAAMDIKVGQDAQHAAARRARERISSAWKDGVSMYLISMDRADAALMIHGAPDVVDELLEGLKERSSTFRRRVRSAEGLFVVLCRELLEVIPEKGLELWRALRNDLQTRLIGVAGIDELVHMVFQAPESEPVSNARIDLLSLSECHSDQVLCEVSLAARLNNRDKWLDEQIELRRESTVSWQRRQAVVLSGFRCNNRLPIPGAWPAGNPRTQFRQLGRDAARRRYLEACARSWWVRYWEATDVDDAFAAWRLFLSAVDFRAFAWLRPIADEYFNSPLAELKKANVKLNFQRIKSKMEKRHHELARTFLGEAPAEGMGPWYNS